MDLISFLFSLASIFAVSILVSWFRSKNKKGRVPLAAGAWPVLGHIRFYVSKDPTHVTFGDMADVYGPIFATKLGTETTLIISSQEIAKECYTAHDKLLDRPSILASKQLGYNDAFMSFSPYGPYWREMRKIVTMELLSNHRLDMQKHYRAGEVDVFTKDLYRRWENRGARNENGLAVDMKREFQDLTANISLMIVAGKRFFGDSPNCDREEATNGRKLIREFLDFFAPLFISDAMPFLGWLDWGVKRAMKRTAKQLDKLLEGWMAEHKEKKKTKEDEKDFMDLLIEIFQSSNVLNLDTHKTTKALCLNLILTGSESSIVVLVWVVSLLVNNPHVLRKAQEELDRKIGKNRAVEESDIKDLVYLQAIVKETCRLYPPVPLVAYRNVSEGFDIANGNYHVPAGSQLLVSAWKIQRDPSLYKNPERFEPERFLTDHEGVDLGGQTFMLFPFGLGRRRCPAIPLGVRMVHYLLARFLHSFHVVNPSSQDVDMTESNGLVNLKATPLNVLIAPRLDPKLYY